MVGEGAVWTCLILSWTGAAVYCPCQKEEDALM